MAGAFRLAPEVLKWLDRRGERGHELAMQDKALEFEKLRGATRMAEITAPADAAWNSGAVEALRETVAAQGHVSRAKWADASSISVRPVITYWFMAIYCAAKTAAFVGAVDAGIDWIPAIQARLDRRRPSPVGRRAQLLVPRPRLRPGTGMIAVPQVAELAKRFEGFHCVPRSDPQRRAHPYICPAGYWTIGYGRLCKPDHPPITEEEGETFLRQDLRTALDATLRHCPVLATGPENRLAAIVDFTFNLGAGKLQTSTLRRRVNERDWQAAARELRRWVYEGGKVLPGLMARREAETLLLVST